MLVRSYSMNRPFRMVQKCARGVLSRVALEMEDTHGSDQALCSRVSRCWNDRSVRARLGPDDGAAEIQPGGGFDAAGREQHGRDSWIQNLCRQSFASFHHC